MCTTPRDNDRIKKTTRKPQAPAQVVEQDEVVAVRRKRRNLRKKVRIQQELLSVENVVENVAMVENSTSQPVGSEQTNANNGYR